MDPVDVLGRVHQIAVAHTDLDAAAEAVAHLTRSLLPAPCEVSVVVQRGTAVHTVAATSAVARVLDGWQYNTGQGPCLQAVASAETVYAADLRTETRWPRWVRHSLDAGAGSVLSLALGIDDTVTGALNVYTTHPDAFPDDAVRLPRSLADYATAALRTIHRYDTQAAHVRHLQAALAHRTVIEQAKGIIMGDRRCTPDEAFTVLAKISQDTNRKVHDVAAALTHRVAITPRPTRAPAPTRHVGAAMTARQLNRSAPTPITMGIAPRPPANTAGTPVRITTDVDGYGVAVIGVVGELVVDTADELLAATRAALSADPVTRVVVDLALVSFLDMAGLSVLLQGRAVTLQAGASFRVVRPQRLVRKILHLTGTCLLLGAAPPTVESGRCTR